MYKLVIFDFDGTLADSARWMPRELRPLARKLPFLARRRRPVGGAETVQLFPGAKALLRSLAGQGVVLGVVSSSSAATVRRILGPEAAALIEHYACGAALFGKAAQFRKVVRRAKVKPAETLCIGDEARDIEAARQAGLACGAVAWGYACREILAARRPTWLFDTPDEVAARLAA